MTLEEILLAMLQHTKDNPTHGRDCACKDQYTRAFRAKLKDLEVQDEFAYAATLAMRYRW